MRVYKVQWIWFLLIWVGIVMRTRQFWRMRSNMNYDHGEIESALFNISSYRAKKETIQ
jgi:hypothetical protein